MIVNNSKENIADVLRSEHENGHGDNVTINCLDGEIMKKCMHYLVHGVHWIMIVLL